MILETPIEEDLKKSYLTYAMSVIVSRAIPDVRDGLKPVQRRILYSAYENKLFSNKPYKKSARLVGDVLGKYHPHGDSAIYDALVRMAQPFSMRYPLIDGHGNFGSIDGDPPAAMRYTEVRMAKIAEEMLKDIDKETVNFKPNFDNSLKEPEVLPTRIPNLLINGSSGIAVGLSTNIPPHNLGEVINALIALLEGKDPLKEIKGPDFPTGGIVLANEELKKAYLTGRGKIIVRGKAKIEGNLIKITEIPYQITKAKLIEEIVENVKKEKIRDVLDIQDRSDKRGLLIEIKVKKNSNANVILNQIYKYTSLQTTYSIINIALVDGKPKQLSLTEMLQLFLNFRREIIRKRTLFLQKKDKQRKEILLGLKKAVEQIDKVVEILKNAENSSKAKEKLKEILSLTDTQSQAVLDMKLSKLIKTEKEQIEKELFEIEKRLEEYNKILTDKSYLDEKLKEELLQIKELYADERKTEIVETLEAGPTIQEKEIIVVIDEKGFIGKLSEDEIKVQRRGGKGLSLTKYPLATAKKTKNGKKLLLFSKDGFVFPIDTLSLPYMNRSSKGKHLSSLIKKHVNPLAILEEKDEYVVLTKKGLIKIITKDMLKNVHKGGIKYLTLKENDEVVDIKPLKENILTVVTAKGKSITFSKEEIPKLGRTSMGVKAIKLENDQAISVISTNKPFIIITKKGYGKTLSPNEIKVQRRGGKGMIIISLNKEDRVVKALEKTEKILISTPSKSIAIKSEEIPTQSRYAKGVRLINTKEEVVSAINL